MQKNPQGGRPSHHYYLNEEQATLVCMFSRTDRAAAARRMIIEVFTRWRRGEMLPPAPPARDPFAVQAARTGHVREIVTNLDAVEPLTHRVLRLPIWTSARRPPWWYDDEVRDWLTANLRKMPIEQAEEKGKAMFGARCPGKSTIGRYWAMVDEACGMPRKRYRPRS